MTATLVNYFCSLKQIQSLVVNARLNTAMKGLSTFLFKLLFPYFYLLLRSPLSDICLLG